MGRGKKAIIKNALGIEATSPEFMRANSGKPDPCGSAQIIKRKLPRKISKEFQWVFFICRKSRIFKSIHTRRKFGTCFEANGVFAFVEFLINIHNLTCIAINYTE